MNLHKSMKFKSLKFIPKWVWFVIIAIIPTLYLIGLHIFNWFSGTGYYEFFNVGNRYYVRYEPHNVYKEYVPPYVEEFKYDSLYIIAKQNPRGKYGLRSAFSRPDISYPNGQWHDYYWIIDKKTNHVYGPLNLDDFNSKKDSLNINLELNTTNE